jgi:hypothetical protein
MIRGGSPRRSGKVSTFLDDPAEKVHELHLLHARDAGPCELRAADDNRKALRTRESDVQPVRAEQEFDPALQVLSRARATPGQAHLARPNLGVGLAPVS